MIIGNAFHNQTLIQPFQPAQPVQPVQPFQPAQPVQPVQPVQPSSPTKDEPSARKEGGSLSGLGERLL